jgi:hypothetical protein
MSFASILKTVWIKKQKFSTGGGSDEKNEHPYSFINIHNLLYLLAAVYMDVYD